jgi:membrane protein DedA with SNARE-associated domain
LGAWFAAQAASFDGNLAWLSRFASLLVLPFAHEDLAIILGAYVIVNDLMPTALVAASIYGGIVASDFALYGLGAGARRLPWLNRYADHRVRQFSETLKRNIFGLVALCRVVPGVVFVAFVACGWARVPLRQFTLASVFVSAIYLPLTLYVVTAFGDTLDSRLGIWTWPLLLSAMVAAGFVRQRIFSFAKTAPSSQAEPVAATPQAGHDGMPALMACDRKVALAERIPPLLFYAPLLLTWIALGIRHRGLTLPSAANPRIPTGGMWGESKSDYFDSMSAAGRNAVAGFVVLQRGGSGTLAEDHETALRLLAEAEIGYPIVAKPDIGWHGHGVRRIEDAAALLEYLAQFPAGARAILQCYVPYAGEAAVLYAREPGAGAGRIVSLTYRYFPHVVGDGRSTVRVLIKADGRASWKSGLHLGLDPTHRSLTRDQLGRVPARGEVVQIALIGNQRAGGLYRDAKCHITPELEARFDAIARSMPEFHYGRFDIRFEHTDALKRGEGFAIVEVNGIGGEAIDVWDPLLSVREVYRRLIAQQRLLFKIGESNRSRGFQPTCVSEFVGLLLRQTKLIQRYPASS